MPTVSDAVLNRRNFTIASLAATLSACGGGGDSEDLPLTAPAILTQPSNVFLRTGAIATFRVIAHSERPMSYQWLRNGSPITGATAAELSVGPVNVLDSGSTFSVRVSNSTGTTQSDSAALMVEAVEGIALAQGALSMLSKDQTAVGFGKGGDVFVWERGPSPAGQNPMRLIRLASDGTPRPLLGNKQALALNFPWRISVLEHSNGSIYVSESYVRGGGINLFRGGYGRIHRITPDGGHSVIYDANTSAIAITPVVLAESPDSKLYALHLNTVTVFEISNTGTPSQVAVLTMDPVEDLGMIFASSPYLNMAVTQTGGVFVSGLGGSIKPQHDPFGGSGGLATSGNYVYAVKRDESTHLSLMRRNPDGSVFRVAGGVAATESGDPEPGPLTGSLGEATRLLGITPEGNLVLGRISPDGYSPQDFRYDRYFIVTPPSV